MWCIVEAKDCLLDPSSSECRVCGGERVEYSGGDGLSASPLLY